MPKFREWRSRPSNREAVSKQRFQRCRECRDWFEPLLSSKEQSCSRCTKRNSRVNETEGEASNLRFIPVRDCRHPAPRQDTSNSVSSPGLGQHTPYRRPAPESDNSRERPTGNNIFYSYFTLICCARRHCRTTCYAFFLNLYFVT